MTPQVLASWVLVLGYAGAIVALVVHGARRNKSVADYAVGNIAFSPVAVGLALAASTTSAATFIINPGLIAYFGLSGAFGLCVVLPVSVAVSLVVLTKGFRKYGGSVKALTLSQWVGQRYRSRGFAVFFAVLSLLLVTFIVMILVGLTKVIAASLALDEIAVLAVVVAFSFGYMMFGGANSMVYTNTIQAAIMIVVALILLGSGWEHFAGGFGGFVGELRAIDPNLASLYNPASPFFRDGFEVIFCTAVVGIAIVCQPHIITKSLLLRARPEPSARTEGTETPSSQDAGPRHSGAYAAGSATPRGGMDRQPNAVLSSGRALEEERAVNRYLVAGIAVQVLFFLVVAAGLYARLEFPSLQAGGQAIVPDAVISTYLVTQFPWYVGVIVFLGLIAAGMSTLEGLIQSLSIIVTNDLVANVHHAATGRDLSDRFRFLLNRGVIAALAVVSFGLAWWQLVAPNLSVILFAQLGVYAYFAAAFVPVLFGTFLDEVPLAAVATAAVVALVVHFGLYYTGQYYFPYYQDVAVKNPGIATALGVVAATLAGGAVHLVAKARARRQSV